MVTIDLNNMLYIILIAVAIILLIFLIVAVTRLIQTLKRVNGILELSLIHISETTRPY